MERIHLFDKLNNKIRIKKLNHMDTSTEEPQQLDALADTLSDALSSCDTNALERDLQYKRNEMRMFTGPEAKKGLKRVGQISEYVEYIYTQCIETYRCNDTDRYLDILNFACMELYLASDKLDGLDKIKNNTNIRIPESVLAKIKDRSGTDDGLKDWVLLFDDNLKKLKTALSAQKTADVFAFLFIPQPQTGRGDFSNI